MLCSRCNFQFWKLEFDKNFSQRLYLALEAVAADHREHGSAGESPMWARLAVYVEAVLRSLYIELSMQVTLSLMASSDRLLLTFN